MAALPEWKLQLLERKRKEEEEGRKREVELQERLSKMPTWKREIIERRRAKLGSGASFSEVGEGGGVSPQHGGPGPVCSGDGGPEEDERTVLQEKIGPVHQNPFIKLEKQRKESTESDSGTKARNMSDIYSQMPGVRTIRAENIIIIESDPSFFQLDDHREENKSKSVEALNSMMAAGSPREIHANEVLIIKSSMSRSVEDLNTINRGQEDNTPGRPRKGQVSQLLSKFGQEKSGWSRTARSLSTENLGDKDHKESCNDDTPSPEPEMARGRPLTIPRWETNGQLKASVKERTSPVSPTSPSTPRTRSANDSRRSPLPTGAEEQRARDHSLSPSRSLPPQHKVTPFQSQLKSKSLEVNSPTSPCRSPGSLSPLVPKPWQRDLLRHVEVAQEPRASMASTPKDVAMPAGERSPLEGPTSLGGPTHGGLGEDHLLNGTQGEGGDQGGTKPEPSWRSHLVDPENQRKGGEAASPPKRTYERESSWEKESTLGQGSAMCLESQGVAYLESGAEARPGSPGPPGPETPVPTGAETPVPTGAGTPVPTGAGTPLSVGPGPPESPGSAAPEPPSSLPVAPTPSRAVGASDPSPLAEGDPQGPALAQPWPHSRNSPVTEPRLWASPPPAHRPCPSPAVPQEASSSSTPPPAPPQPRAQSPAPPSEPQPEPPSMSRLYNLRAPSPGPPPRARPDEGRPPPFSLRQPGACFYQPERAGARPGGPEQGPQRAEESPGRGGPPQGPQRAEESPGRGGPLQGGQEEGAPARRGGPLPGAAHPSMQRKSGNTITINPRKAPPGAPILENGGPAVPVEADAASRTEGGRPHPLKKRYPTAEEIKVIGGYQAPGRSCLSKSAPQRRKMELSFSESDLERIFEYPSEESLLEEFGPPEETEAQPPNTQNDDEEEEEVPQNGLAGSGSVGHIMRTKPLIVDESCRR
ncbi:phostensin [Lissotriton helveticus]